jgi:septal ring-binding cell division protein DamX
LIRILFTTAVLLGTLPGCSSTVVPAKVGPNGEYIGWHCSGDITSESDWRCEQKTLKDGKVVTAAAPPPAAAPVAQSSQEPTQEPVKESAPIVESVPSPVAEAAPAKTEQSLPTKSLPTTGYSLQLGAYLSRQQAEEAAADMVLSGTLEVREIISQGRAFSVILLGHYPTRNEAEAAAQNLTISYWVRSMRSLADAAVD